MDPRTLEDTADNLERLAVTKRAEADKDETLAATNRDDARRLRDEQKQDEADERAAEDALNRR